MIRYRVSYASDATRDMGATDLTCQGPITDADVQAITEKLRESLGDSGIHVTGWSPYAETTS